MQRKNPFHSLFIIQIHINTFYKDPLLKLRLKQKLSSFCIDLLRLSNSKVLKSLAFRHSSVIIEAISWNCLKLMFQSKFF